jgi:hypothetical protein
MATWHSLWSFGIFFPIWYARTKKNLATLFYTYFSRKTLNGRNLARNLENFLEIRDAHNLSLQQIGFSTRVARWFVFKP